MENEHIMTDSFVHRVKKPHGTRALTVKKVPNHIK